MMQKVRVGLVSTSWWAETMFLPSLQSHSQAEVAAICGRNQARAGTIASRYGIPAVFADYRRMIEQASLDALIVAAPDDLHYAITMQALDAGLHVLCEKPLASNVQQAREMADAARAAGVKHMVMYTFRWMPPLQYVRDLITQGYLGRLYHCEFRYLLDYARKPEYAWRLDRKRANGLLGDIGSHLIDTARWLVGDFASVRAQLGYFSNRVGADGQSGTTANDAAFLLATFTNGAQGILQASGVAHLPGRAPQQQVRLYGADGSLEIDLPPFGPGAEVMIRAARAEETQFQSLETPPVYWEKADPAHPSSVFTQNRAGARLFIDAILHDEPLAPNFDDGYKVQQVIDAAIESDQMGCAVTIGP